MNVSIANAKAHLSELLARVERGEEVVLTRHGRPVARLTAEPKRRRPLDIEALARLRATMPKSAVPAGDTVRKMRDEERY